jgi:hypothetical protein
MLNGIESPGNEFHQDIVSTVPSLDAFRTFAAVCPPGMLAAIPQPGLATGGLYA